MVCEFVGTVVLSFVVWGWFLSFGFMTWLLGVYLLFCGCGGFSVLCGWWELWFIGCLEGWYNIQLCAGDCVGV